MNSRVMERINTRQVYKSYRDGIVLPNTYPKSLVLDVTNRCNYRCPLCPTGSMKSGRPVGDIEREMAMKAIDECSQFIEMVTFGFSGEPLLYTALTDLIGHAHKSGVKTKLFTNLSILPQSGFEKIVEKGIDHIVISLDGVNDEQYSFYRKGGDFEEVLNNIQILVDANKKQKKHHAIIETQMLVTSRNEESIEAFISLSNSLGVDRAKIKYLNLGLDPDLNTAMQYLPKNQEYHYYDINSKQIMLRREFINKAMDRKCAELYYGPVIIAWDGSYILCCRDERHIIKLGSFQETSIWDYWNSNELQRIRERQMHHEMALCEMCPASFMETFEIIPAIDDEPLSISDHEAPNVDERQRQFDTSFMCDTTVSKLLDWSGKRTILSKGDIIDYGAYRTHKL